MIDKLKRFLHREKKLELGSYLKKLSINRQDLIPGIGEIDLDSPINAYLTLAILLKEKGEYYKSLKLLEKLKREKLSQDEERLLILNLSLVYRSAGFVDRAEEALKEGIKKFPDESFFYYELARLKRATGRLEEAVELLERASHLKEEFTEELLYTKLYLANTYIDKGRTDKAFRIIRKLRIKLPFPLFYYVISKLYYSVDEKEKAFKSSLKGMKLSPGHSYPFLKVMEENGDLNLKNMERIIKELPLTLPIVKKYLQLLRGERKEREALEFLDSYFKAEGKFTAELMEEYLKLLWKFGKRRQVVDAVLNYLEKLKKEEKLFKCRNCGFKTDNYDWICPRCKCWESLEIGVEEERVI